MNHDDEKQLRLLSRLHYVAAALAGVIPLSGALYGTFGAAILLGKLPGSTAGQGEGIGWLALGTGIFVLLIGAGAVALNLICGRALRKRQNHTLCLLTSAMNCVYFPLGTLLGTFTIIVLCRPAVRAAFNAANAADAADATDAPASPGPTPRVGGTHCPTSAIQSR
jgi:hypothetical protein